MRKIELLAPAGSFDALVAAVNSGADAIYLGGSMFNARAFATNFSNEELKEAVEFAHLHEVKIYVTVNTLFYDEEFEQLLKYIDFLYSINVDALIIQDIGLLNVVKENYPDFEIHMSTQASVHQLAGVKLYENQNVDRVVLARENTLEEIKYICQNTSLDIEVFVHGALCMGYSGQCLMSSLIGGRSGNRGKCAQPCRLPYTLKENENILDTTPHYLLSAKDICAIENIGDYIEAGVTSFKIEGRMKRPEYVGLIIKSYREAIDHYLKNEEYKNVKIQKEKINQMFNRGLSLGHAYNEKKLITYDFPGNFGVEIGTVENYNAKKKLVSIKLNKELVQGDGIRFGLEDNGRVVNKMYNQNRLVNTGYENDLIEIEFNVRIKPGTKVYKTSSIKLLNEVNHDISSTKFNFPVDITLSGDINTPLTLTATDGKYNVTVKSEELIETAMSKPLDHERIIQQISKLGSTIYQAEKVNLQLPENIQFPIKVLNQLRRDAMLELDDLRKSNNRSNAEGKLPKLTSRKKTINELYIHVNNVEQAKAALECNIKTLFVPFNDELENILCMKEDIDVIPYVSRIIDDHHLEAIKEHPAYSKINKIMVGDVGALHKFIDKEVILDTSLNITNSYSLNSPIIENTDVILSLELSEKQINQLKTDKKIGIVAYGKSEMMVSKYCPISQHYFKQKREKCNLCKRAKYHLVDRKHENFPIIMDDLCRMHLFNSKTLFIDRFKGLEVDFIVLKFTDESIEEMVKVINDYRLNLSGLNQSRIKENYNYTVGYYKK